MASKPPLSSKIDWEKIGVYLALVLAFFTVISYLMDVKERVAKLEVKVEHLEK